MQNSTIKFVIWRHEMLTFTAEIINCIHKYYNINKEDAQEIVNDEWDYIEEEFVKEQSSAKEIAKNLISLYMVA